MQIDLSAIAVIAFLVPGILALHAQALLASVDVEWKAKTFISAMVYALICRAISSLIVGVPLASGSSGATGDLLAAPTLVAIGVGLLLGFVWGAVARCDVIRWLLRRAGLHARSSVPSAWEKGWRAANGRLVRLTFKDGSERYAAYGTKSHVNFVGDDPDVFLEAEWCETGDGLGLRPLEGGRGIWVRQSQLACFRVYDVEALGEVEQSESSRIRDIVHSTEFEMGMK